MNIREGLRRCALVAGLVGGTYGGILGYDQASLVWQERTLAQDGAAVPTASGEWKPPARDSVLPAAPGEFKPPPLDSWEGPARGDGASAKDSFTPDGGAPSIPTLPPGYKLDQAGGRNSQFDPDKFMAARANVPVNPSRAAYLFAILWPFGGFLLPWGSVCTFSWIVCGFLETARAKEL